MKKQKRNNKGFSMVELIIVIAIMAILTAVTAPQYLKYVEKSRVSADENTIDEFKTALNVIVADEDTPVPTGDYSVTISKTSVTVASVTTGGSTTVLVADLTELLGTNYATAKMKSQKYTKGYKFDVSVDDTPTVTGAIVP